MELTKLAGYKLGKRIVRYEERDAILYALAVGATGSETDLVYERDLRVLPTYACALGLWTVEAVRMTAIFLSTPHNRWKYFCHCLNPGTSRLPEKSPEFGTKAKRHYWILKLSANISRLRMEFSYWD